MADVLTVETRVGDSVLKAEFHTLSGRLRIREDGAVSKDFLPPDSWIMIASCSSKSLWGTCPSRVDLMNILQQHMQQLAKKHDRYCG
jgi:hypothetical protein